MIMMMLMMMSRSKALKYYFVHPLHMDIVSFQK